GFPNAMIVLGTSLKPMCAGRVLAAVIRAAGEVHVEAPRALRAQHLSILDVRILPNALPPIIVHVTLSMATAILSASCLGFLGLGAQPPTPEWGAMLNEGRRYLRSALHVSVFPGAVIMLAILAFNLFGDGLRDALDPRANRG